jgi:hypothetical protein
MGGAPGLPAQRKLKSATTASCTSCNRSTVYLCLSAPPITIESNIAANPAGFTLRLSSCRFHDASTNDISGFNSGSKKPSKTMRFQWLKTWLRDRI